MNQEQANSPIVNSSREFAIRELHYHQEQKHNICFDKRGGFFCLSCRVGCVGQDVGDLKDA